MQAIVCLYFLQYIISSKRNSDVELTRILYENTELSQCFHHKIKYSSLETVFTYEKTFVTGIYVFKVKNGNTRTMCKI